ncbi:helix-turn-helix domain-containing protein, partial [Pantoea ananatis]
NVASVALPPLRQRCEDIPVLANYFLQSYARRLGRPQLRLSDEAMETLKAHSWPGNIRELENTLHNAVLLCETPQVEPQQLRLGTVTGTGRVQKQDALDDFIRQQIQCSDTPLYPRVIEALVRNAYELSQGNQLQAAALLGISRNSLRTHLGHYGIIKPRRSLTSTLCTASTTGAQERELRIGYQKFGNLGILKARQQLEQQ